ncbi:DUF7507 domain-containing protein, partial [Microbacterium sp. gxy059]|uniref:DUF7927 domain-containing protein n=1 Tax=Microbacterium sp. gxy059 TaxID=2957199 RepID=UPI003D993D2D
PGYVFGKSSDPVSGSEVQPGDTVTYTLSGENTGDTDLDVVIDDDLSDVLQYAQFNDDAVATVGGEEASAPVFDAEASALSWTGVLEPGDVVEVTYSVTVDDDAWDVSFANVATSTGTPPTGPPITPPPGETEHHTPP